MLGVQSEILAAPVFHGAGTFVGDWAVDLEPTVKENLIPAGSPAESLKLSAIAPAVHERLILAWTLQRKFGSEVCDRLDLTCKGGNHN